MPNDAQCWGLIERADPRRGPLGRIVARFMDAELRKNIHEQRLIAALGGWPPEEIVAFKVWFEAQMDRAHDWNLWNAAYLMMGGCGDDSFEYFRAWLIAQGRRTFERVLGDPDCLAELWVKEPLEECEFEALQYAPAAAYEEKTGEEIWAKLPVKAAPAEPRGQRLAEDELAARFPRIAGRWG